MKPLCLSIGGFDPTGGAGVTLDRAVFTELSVNSCELITILTEQTTDKVNSIREIDTDYFLVVFNRLLKHYKFNAVKVSLVSRGVLEILEQSKPFNQIPFKIVDPVLESSSGYEFIDVESLLLLIKNSNLVTPNLFEFNKIINLKEGERLGFEAKVKLFKDKFPGVSALIKGVGAQNEDFLITKDGDRLLTSKSSFRSSNDVHGTGCLLSAAITANLSKGLYLVDSINEAKTYLSKKLDQSYQLQDDIRFKFLF